MPRKTPEEKLAELEELKRQREEKAEKALSKIENDIKATKARLAEKERKIDTRRKIIAGAVALEHAEKNPDWGKAFFDILNRAVTRSDDRDILGLPASHRPPD